MPAGSGGSSAFPWYAVIVTERGVPRAMVLTGLEWQSDQTKGPYSANFKEIGGYNTQAEAQAAANAFNSLPNPQKISQAGITSGSVPTISNPLQPMQDIGNFFHTLTQSSTWARVGEVAIGGILLFIGVRALSQGSSAVGSGARKSVSRPAKKAATKVIKVAAPEARLATRVAAKKAAPKTTARVAAHRANVAKYGQKKPYQVPAKRQPTVRVSHIYHHKGPKP